MIAGAPTAKRTRRDEAYERRVEQHARKFAACAADLRARGVEPRAVFALTAQVPEERRDATCEVVVAGDAFFVRHDSGAGVHRSSASAAPAPAGPRP